MGASVQARATNFGSIRVSGSSFFGSPVTTVPNKATIATIESVYTNGSSPAFGNYAIIGAQYFAPDVASSGNIEFFDLTCGVGPLQAANANFTGTIQTQTAACIHYGQSIVTHAAGFAGWSLYAIATGATVTLAVDFLAVGNTGEVNTGTVTEYAGFYAKSMIRTVSIAWGACFEDPTGGPTLNGNIKNWAVGFKVAGGAVAHGMTDLIATDAYGGIKAKSMTNGGLQLMGFSETDRGVEIQGNMGGTPDATRSTAGVAPVMLKSQLKSTATVGTIGADKNLVTIGDGGLTRFIFDSDGDSHQDVGTAWTNFDDQDDWRMARGLVASIKPLGDPLRERHAELVAQYRPILETGKLVTYNEDGHHFLNMKRTLLFTLDMGFQMGERIWGENGLAAQVQELRLSLTEANRKLALLGA